MKPSINYLMRMILLSVALGCGIEAMAESPWPSASLENEYARYGDFEQYSASLRHSPGEGAFGGVWMLATRGSKIDNRAYLFALAFDIYNTIPPDLMPERRELGPDEDVYEPNLAPIKNQLWFKVSGLSPEFKKTQAQKKSSWNVIKNKIDPIDQPGAIELTYIFEKITEFMEAGLIALDKPGMPASLIPAQLNIENPTHYQVLHEYMSEMIPAMEARVPPWEAERYLVSWAEKKANKEKGQKKKEAAEVGDIDKSKKQAKKKAGTIKETSVDEAENVRHIVIIITIVVLGLLLMLYLVQRRKK